MLNLIRQIELQFFPQRLAIAGIDGRFNLLVGGFNKPGKGVKYIPDIEKIFLKIYDQYGAEKDIMFEPQALVDFIAVSPNQKMALIGERNGLLRIDISTLHGESILDGLQGRFNNVSFINRSSEALLKENSGLIWKIDIESNTATRIKDASEESGNVLVHPDGDHFVFTRAWKRDIILEISSWKYCVRGNINELTFQADYISSLSFNHKGDLFAFTLDHLYLFHYPSLEPVLRIEKSGKINEDFSMENLSESEVWTDIIFSQDDRFLYFGNNVGGEIIRVDLINKSSEVLVKTHKDAIRKIAMSVDDSIMAAIGIDSTLRVWRMETD